MTTTTAPPMSAYARHYEMTERFQAAAAARRSAVVERVEDWVACYGMDGAAERFPASAGSTARLLYRAGRPDLARAFERVAGRERRACAAQAVTA